MQQLTHKFLLNETIFKQYLFHLNIFIGKTAWNKDISFSENIRAQLTTIFYLCCSHNYVLFCVNIHLFHKQLYFMCAVL